MAEVISPKTAKGAAAVVDTRKFCIWNTDKQKFRTNQIITSRYTALNFFPKNLFEQFHRAANCYFLTLTLLQCVPEISITGGVPTILLPLIVVLSATAVKDAIEDWRRHKSDAEENNRSTDYVAADGTVKSKPWTKVEVGDILIVRNQEFFPADLLLLASNDPHGIVYIETANLDGETNLKLKQAHEGCVDMLGKGNEDLEKACQTAVKIHGAVECQPPNKFLYQFEGTLHVERAQQASQKVLVSFDASKVGDQNVKAAIDAALSKDGGSPPTVTLQQKHVAQIEVANGGLEKVKASLKAPDVFPAEWGTPNISEAEEKLPLDPKQVLLRSCKLRNTTWCLGIVIYTGPETKIQMNSAGKRARKVSKVEHAMSRLTVYIFALQCLIGFIGAVGGAVFDTASEANTRTYLNLLDENDETKNPAWIGFVRFFTFMLLFANFIPISLLVTMGIAKLFQVLFIHKDEDMRYNGQLSVPRNSDLNEELGQVDFCFTDKTGTLTCNVMEFRSFCVAGQVYGDGITEIRRNVLRREGKPVPVEPKPEPGSKVTKNVNLISHQLDDLLKRKEGDQYFKVRNLLLHLAINHDVMPEFKDHPKEGRQLLYSASSPDEGALVYGARHFGFMFKERQPGQITVELDDGSLLKVRIRALLEFNSRRKRSSVIVQFQDKLPNGTTKERFAIFCKGADSVIKELLNQNATKDKDVMSTFDRMEDFARDGLRTLVLAGRDLEASEFESWFARFEEANLSMEDRAAKVEKAAAEIEQEFDFHGVTGIEDRLQDGVAETITKMQEAGVKVWMLTGDKVETAINIGVATGLLEPTLSGSNFERPVLDWDRMEVPQGLEDELSHTQLLQLAKHVYRSIGGKDGNTESDQPPIKRKSSITDGLSRKASPVDMDQVSRESLQKKLTKFEEAFNANDQKTMDVMAPKLQLEAINAAKRKQVIKILNECSEKAGSLTASMEASMKEGGFGGAFEAVVCDGGCLAVALEDKYNQQFVDMCRTCKTVVCCRVSPEQKGAVVRLIKEKEKVITLAIGDGANDCNMITSADVGIGLRGEEGLQAFNVCDYGISQFRFLQYLLLVHGRWAYRRVTKLVLYMFYKNIVVVGPQFFYALTNGFSGQKLYHDVMYQSYNVFFTALPILVFGILDQDVSKAKSLEHPELYHLGRHQTYFNNKVFMQWMACGLWHAAVVFVVPYFALSNGAITFQDGKSNDIWLVGTVVYLLVVIVANVKVIIETAHMNYFVYGGVALSLLAWLGVQAILSGASGKMSSATSGELFGTTGRLIFFESGGLCWTFYLVVIGTTMIACCRDWQWKALERMWYPNILHAVQQEMLDESKAAK